MVTEELMYWITRLDHVLMTAKVVCLLSLIAFCSLALVFFISETEKGVYSMVREVYQRPLRRWMWIFAPIILISVLVINFLPTTHEMIAIKVIPAIANNDGREIGEDLRKLTKEWIEEMTPGEKKD